MNDVQRWESELQLHGETRIETARGKLVWALLGCLAFTALGVLILLEGEWMVGLPTVLFFGVVGFPVLVLRSRRPSTLVVTPHEVRLTHNVMPWPHTVAVTLDVVARQKLVSLRLTGEGYETLRGTSSPGMLWLSSANVEVMGSPTLTLPSELRADKTALASWLTTVRERTLAPAEPVAERDDVIAAGDPEKVPAPDDHRRFMPPGT